MPLTTSDVTTTCRGREGTCSLQGIECPSVILSQGHARVSSELRSSCPPDLGGPGRDLCTRSIPAPRAATAPCCPPLPESGRGPVPGRPLLVADAAPPPAGAPSSATTTPEAATNPRSPPTPPKNTDVHGPALSALFSSPLCPFPHLQLAAQLRSSRLAQPEDPQWTPGCHGDARSEGAGSGLP